jgi:signal transduction histidine kinase
MSDGLAIVIATSFLNTLLASLVVIRNPKAVINRIFGFFALSIILWTVCNYLADALSSNNLLLTRLTFVAAIPLALSLFYLSNVFPNQKMVNSNKIVKNEVRFSILLAILCLTPWLVPDVTKTDSGVNLSVGLAYPLYVVYIFQILLMIISNFIRSYKKSDSEAKSQIKILLTGIVTYALLAIASNLVIPLFADSWSSTKIGPIFTLFFVGFTGYAIIRHRFLDIRLVVARSLAYVFSFGTIAALFTLSTFAITSLIFGDSNLTPSQERLLYTFLAISLSLIFGPVRKFFNKVTATVFYRDSYDSEIFLDEFNKLLVATFELNPLLKSASATISDNLKPSFCAFVIRETDSRPVRVIGTLDHPNFKDGDINFIRKGTLHLTSKVTAVDDLADDHKELQARLRKNGIAVVSRLTPVTHDEGVGYLLLGPKKSGNLYSSQDISVLEIITNELVIAVQNSLRFEEIENFNATLQQKVEEATRKLRHANDRLKQLDETKDDFISMASHQLRTPLTSIKGYISMVMEGDAGKLSKTQQDMLWQAFTSSQRMVYLIADLLNVSRLKTGKFIIEKKPINLADVIEQELAQVDKVAGAKNVKIVYDKPKNFPELMIDDTKTRQVIMNLVDNAIYYTPSGGKVNIELIDKPSTIEFKVKDNGMGVPKSEQHHLFGKFYRAGNARKARPDGTGLGLFMAKKVVIAQGGAIIFESKEGEGSTFGFMFSKAKLSEPVKPPVTKALPAAERT